MFRETLALASHGALGIGHLVEDPPAIGLGSPGHWFGIPRPLVDPSLKGPPFVDPTAADRSSCVDGAARRGRCGG